ncbi:thiamine-phosphate pyrophosphorylase [Sporomusaceae bacterium BoRhaA]|uniref:thiamine phosphate synthase n=1 Tax=Pelorhabdus rhamnosifermentans TaxID=2772457 RepID=UPI001C064474|nr:thiamine phosphate synthase [Pelorhabdus rhamnosifermentans]MBU2701449.1 thiamine-phosphate pyrophosphorylase [Pelorhabdus rhamnosifermentans]
MLSKRKNPLPSDLYALTAEEYSLGRSNIAVVKEMLEAGIKIIQYREKGKKQRVKYEECQEIRKMTLAYDATFIVDDDVEIAKLVGADGIHIGQEDLPIDVVRNIVGEDMIIGLSTHSPEQAEAAVRAGADYLGVGPIFSTKTKKDVCSPVGFDYLDYVVSHVTIPFVAIGGIKANNVAEVVKHGANCVALVTEIVGASNIPVKIAEIQQKIAIAIVK